MIYKVKRNPELKHHGIGGQKWGVRNGPPYPLGGNAHSKREKAAGTKGWTKEAKSEVRVKRSTSNKKAGSTGNTNDKSKKGLSSGQKKAIAIGAGVALTALGGYTLYKTGKLDNVIAQYRRKGMTVMNNPDFKGISSKRLTELRENMLSKKFRPGESSKVSNPLHKAALRSQEVKEMLKENTKNVSGIMSGSDSVSKILSEKYKSPIYKESTNTIISRANKLKGNARKNSCFQTALSVFFSENGIPMTAKADIGPDGIGLKHNVINEMINMVPSMVNSQGELSKDHIRSFTTPTKIANSSEAVSKKIVEWFGDNSEGLISTNIFVPETGKMEGHVFNFKTKNGVVSFKDGLVDSSLQDKVGKYFDLNPPLNGRPLDVIRLDNIPDIDIIKAEKFIQKR